MTWSHHRPWPCVTTTGTSMPLHLRGSVPARCAARKTPSSCGRRLPPRPSSRSAPVRRRTSCPWHRCGHRPSRVSCSPANTPDASMAGAKRVPFLIGPVGDDDRVFGLDAEIVQRADDLQTAEHAPTHRHTCRRWAGYRGGCRHRRAARRGSGALCGGRTWCPSGSRAHLLGLTSSHQRFEQVPAFRILVSDWSGGCCRRPRPVRSWRHFHERIPKDGRD